MVWGIVRSVVAHYSPPKTPYDTMHGCVPMKMLRAQTPSQRFQQQLKLLPAYAPLELRVLSMIYHQATLLQLLFFYSGPLKATHSAAAESRCRPS